MPRAWISIALEIHASGRSVLQPHHEGTKQHALCKGIGRATEHGQQLIGSCGFERVVLELGEPVRRSLANTMHVDATRYDRMGLDLTKMAMPRDIIGANSRQGGIDVTDDEFGYA